MNDEPTWMIRGIKEILRKYFSKKINLYKTP